MAKTYLCENPACSLGAVGESGRFSGGQTAEQAFILSGDPEAKGGTGICPNCGKPGKEE
jgi:hypothetical protein